MSLLTNDSHTHKGDTLPTFETPGRVSRPQKTILKDSANNEYEHIVPHVVKESNKPVIDQNLSANDYTLKAVIELGGELSRVVPQARDRFEQIDMTMATLYKFDQGYFDKPAEPDTVTPAPTVEPVNTAE